MSVSRKFALIRRFVVAGCCRILAHPLSSMRQELVLRWPDWIWSANATRSPSCPVAKHLGEINECDSKETESYLEASWKRMNCATLKYCGASQSGTPSKGHYSKRTGSEVLNLYLSLSNKTKPNGLWTNSRDNETLSVPVHKVGGTG